MTVVRNRSTFVFTGVLLAVGIAVAFYTAVNAAGGTTLAFAPPVVSAGVGMDAGVALEISSDQSVQGLDVEFSFDPAVLQAVDADGGVSGVQVGPGTCPAPDFVILNDVDNGAGTGRYAAVEFNTSCTSGDAFSVVFTCIAEGSSQLEVTSSTISDPNGGSITHSVFDGTVNCQGNAIYLPLIVR